MNGTLVVAPAHLGARNRIAFYEEALEAMAAIAGSGIESPSLVVDMSQTTGIDSMGLSTLVLLQLRAAERKMSVTLRGPSEEVRFLLLMTRLEDRFNIER